MRKQRRVTIFHFLRSRPFSLKALFVLGILLIVLVSMFFKSGALYAAPSAPKITCKQWNYVSSPSPNTGDDLYGVAAVSSTDVWAVGDTYDSNNTLTLAEHYDGTQWSVASTPTPSGVAGADLSGVAAVSSTDVWAVGGYWDANYGDYTLIEQWNGTSWNIVPSPNPGSGQDAFFNGVAAISATDVWAVGQYDSNTLIEQWNGTSWNVVPSPTPGVDAQLYGVSAISSTDVWVVGYYGNSNGYDLTLIEHWNGSAWNVISSPNPGSSLYDIVSGVAAVSTTHAWAVGAYVPSTGNTPTFKEHESPFAASRFSPYSGAGGPSQTLIERWNGTSWSIVSSPNPTSRSALSGIAAISNKNIWAVGSYGNSKGTKGYSLIEHWNGKQWKIIPASSPGSSNGSLSSVASIPSTSSLWAAGTLNTGTLTEYYC